MFLQACAIGPEFLTMAEDAIRILDGYTDQFPLQIKRCPADNPDGTWKVNMSVSTRSCIPYQCTQVY